MINDIVSCGGGSYGPNKETSSVPNRELPFYGSWHVHLALSCCNEKQRLKVEAWLF